MILKITSLVFLNFGLLVISFLLFFIGSLLFASAGTNRESPIGELIICCLLAIIHIGINIFIISKRSELPLVYTIVTTVLVFCIYLYMGISLIK